MPPLAEPAHVGGAPQRSVVTIGGRSSAQLAIEGLGEDEARLTCILGVADSGSATGVLRSYYPIPAMGDIRTALATLAQRHAPDSLLAEIFEYRFPESSSADLTGMAVGNIVIAALTLARGRLSEAVARLNALIPSATRILPISDDPLILTARLRDGTECVGELQVRGLDKSPIASIAHLNVNEGVLPEARQAILEAGLIILGPGCLYTSVIAAIATPGVTEALAGSHAQIAWIANTTTTPGQTDGMDLVDHVTTMVQALRPARLHHALVQTEPPPPEVRQAYAQLGLHWLEPREADLEAIRGLGVHPLLVKSIETPPDQPRSLHKLDTIRHDPRTTMRALLQLLRG